MKKVTSQIVSKHQEIKNNWNFFHETLEGKKQRLLLT